jgi:hypothetical protein
MDRCVVDYRTIAGKIIVCCGVVFLALHIMVDVVNAGLQVSYYSDHLEIPVGGSQTRTLRVTNVGSEREDVRVFYQDWIREPNGDHRYLEGGSLERSLFDWIKITPLNFSLDPGQYQDVSFTLSVPRATRNPNVSDVDSDVSYIPVEGTYWGIIMIEPVDTPKSPGQGVGISAVFRHGVKVSVTVPGTGVLDGAVTRITVAEDKPTLLLPEDSKDVSIIFLLEFENKGTVLAKTQGYVEVLNPKGELLSRMDIYPKDMTVLPGETLRYASPYVGPDLGPGQYLVLGVIDYGGSTRVAGQLMFRIRAE